jgi:hypothetical protein
MLHRVAEGFLQNTKQADQHVLWDVLRNLVVREVDLDFLLLGIFFAGTPYGKMMPSCSSFEEWRR